MRSLIRKNNLFLFCALFALLWAGTIKDPSSRAEVFSSLNREILQNSRAYESLKEATEKIGHRLTGSENGRKAEEFTYNLFRQYGFEDVKYQEFETEAWARGAVSLSVESPDAHFSINPKAVTLAHSPVKADVKGEMVDAGNGLRIDFERVKDQVKGKIVLMNIGVWPKDSTLKNLHRSEKTTLAIEYGATGIVFVNTVEGRVILTGTASVTGSLIPIPAVCIALEDGKEIRDQLKKGSASAHIVMSNTNEKIKSRNVIATIRGKEFPDEVVILGGHLDSWDLATGSIDNGIGSFTILEIARAFKTLRLAPRRTVKFVMFMGEEQGLLGSKAMVKELMAKGSLDKVRYMINLDMAGNTKGFNIMGRSEVKELVEEITRQIREVDSSFAGEIRNKPGLHSDHESFMLEGIPVLNTISRLDPEVYRFYHSDGDHFHLVNKDHMNNCARFTGMLLYALADVKELPLRRYSPDQTRDFLIKANLKDELVLGKGWRWK